MAGWRRGGRVQGSRLRWKLQKLPAVNSFHIIRRVELWQTRFVIMTSCFRVGFRWRSQNNEIMYPGGLPGVCLRVYKKGTAASVTQFFADSPIQ